MSMRYYAVSDYGLLLDEETIKIIASKLFEDFSEDEKEDWGYLLYDHGICEYISDFTGEAQQLSDNGTVVWSSNGEVYNDDVIYYIALSKYPTLFNGAYSCMDELIDEFKENLGEYLPDDFNYRNKIRHISGTYFG